MKSLRFAVVPFDSLALVATVVAVVIAITGGGTFVVLEYPVRAHSVGNLVAFLSLWVGTRYLLRRVPLLLVPALPLSGVPQRALGVVDSLAAALERLTAGRALWIIASVACVMTVVKLVVALTHPGFFSGDDVEIHEMTLRVLLGTDWTIWDLRSAFYPMSFIYPVQWAAFQLGLTETAHLVTAGRCVVVVLSSVTVVMLYSIARRRADVPTAMVAAILLATSSLYVEFGATELPRPVAALFVLGAFGTLTGARRSVSALIGGGLLGVAACLRFSEVVFLAPVVVGLVMAGRWRHAAWATGAFVFTAGTIQIASDYWYWGDPLHSARAIVEFTLVQKLSSRGYDPPWYYAREATSWSDVLVLTLALYGTRRNLQLALWVWLPILALSVLPHKEPRYLIPLTPLLCLLAAGSGVALLRELRSKTNSAAAAVAVALVAAIPLRFVDQVSRYHITRSDSEVRFARRVAPSLATAPAMVEQGWRFGSDLYLGRGRSVIDLDPEEMLSAVANSVASRSPPSIVIVSTRTCEAIRCAVAYETLGFVEEQATGLDGRYRVFGRKVNR